MRDTSPPVLHYTLAVQPIDDEATDIDAHSIATTVRDDLWQEFGAAPATTVRVLPTDQRSDGAFEVIQQLGQAATDHSALLAIYAGSLVTLITRLLKHRRVGKVELRDGERTLVIEDADAERVEPLVAAFLASQPSQPPAPEPSPASPLAPVIEIVVRTVKRITRAAQE